MTVQPGGEATTTFVVRNTSSTIQRVTLEIAGGAAAWSLVEPANVSLLPGGERDVQVRFRPPREPTIRAGSMPFQVRAVPRESPGETVVEEGELAIGSFHWTTADIDPTTSVGLRGGRHVVTVSNRGNEPVTVHLEGADPDGNLAVEVDPAQAHVEPGSSTRATVKVRRRPGSSRIDTAPRFFKVKVTATPPAGGQPIILDAALRVRKAPVRAVARALTTMVAVAGLVVGVALFAKRALQSNERTRSTGTEPVATTVGPGTTGPAGATTPASTPGSTPGATTGEAAAIALGAVCRPTADLQSDGRVLRSADGTFVRLFADEATSIAARDFLKRRPTVCSIGNAANEDSELTFFPPPVEPTPQVPGGKCPASARYNPGAVAKAPSQGDRTFVVEVLPRQFLFYSNALDRDRAFALLQGHSQICWLGGGDDIFSNFFDWEGAVIYF